MPPESSASVTWREPDNSSSLLRPLDIALEYIRERGLVILPTYIWAMTPFSLAILFLIDAISAQHRSNLPFGCLLLTLATLWRWVGISVLQRRVQEDLRGDAPLPLRKRVWQIILTRLVGFFAFTWGGVAILPAFYGFFISCFAAPLLLENNGKTLKEISRGLAWIHKAASRLGLVLFAYTILSGLLMIGILVLKKFFLDTVLPEFMGIETEGARLTLNSSPGAMCMFYFLFLLFDFFWLVASVMLYYDIQSRRLGSDLRAKLGALQAGATND